MLHCVNGESYEELARAVLIASLKDTTCSEEEQTKRAEIFGASLQAFSTSEYITALEQVVVQSLRAPQDATRVAEQGLQALNSMLEFERDGKRTVLDNAVAECFDPNRRFDTYQVQGQTAYEKPDAELKEAVEFIRELVSNTKAEPSALRSLQTLSNCPEWCDLRNSIFVVIGALNEMSPTRELLKRGATVLAIDSPSRDDWDELKRYASRETSGTLSLPYVNKVVGANLVESFVELAHWIVAETRSVPATIFVTLDESNPLIMFLQAAAVDALLEFVCNQVPDSTVAHFASCADVQSVSPDTAAAKGQLIGQPLSNKIAPYITSPVNVLEVTERQVGGGRVPLGSAIKAQSHLGRHDANARSYFVVNPVLDPMFVALARLIQRWRTIVARAIGTHRWLADKRKHRVVAQVLPLASTERLRSERTLFVRQKGFELFGVQSFDPGFLRNLGTLLMIRDLRDPYSPSNPTYQIDNPWDIFQDSAIHGGAWIVNLRALARISVHYFVLSRVATMLFVAIFLTYFA